MAVVKLSLPTLEVVYKDMFIMLSLYRMTHKWFMENEYRDPSDDPSLESSGEILYWVRVGTHHNPQENELRLWWRTKKWFAPVGTSSSSQYQYHIDVDWNVINMTNKEIMHEGKREKVQHAELRIMIRPYIEVGDLKSTPLLKYFDTWFRSRLIKKNLEENRKMLYQDAYRLQGTIKKYLELKTFLPVEPYTFHEKFQFL